MAPRQLYLRIVFLLVALSVCPLSAQVTVRQLVSFVQSSIQFKHPDKQVAVYLLKLKLTERLDAGTVQELEGLGAGPATMEALHRMVESSASLPVTQPKPAPLAPTFIAPPSLAAQKLLIERVREYALHYSKNLPNFICTQVTRRYDDPTGLEFWRPSDTLTTRLSYFEQKETYKLVMINDRPTEQSYESLGGALSQGEFGSMLHEIFDPDTKAAFEWLRWGTLRGRRTHVYSYHVAQPNSQFTINYQHAQEVTVGYSGLIYVDRDTEMVLKVTQDGENIPPSFPIQRVTSALDYDYTKIGEQIHLLPIKAEVRMRHNKLLTRNIVEFHLYRKFGADASITFDTPQALPDDKTKEEPVK